MQKSQIASHISNLESAAEFHIHFGAFGQLGVQMISEINERNAIISRIWSIAMRDRLLIIHNSHARIAKVSEFVADSLVQAFRAHSVVQVF